MHQGGATEELVGEIPKPQRQTPAPLSGSVVQVLMRGRGARSNIEVKQRTKQRDRKRQVEHQHSKVVDRVRGGGGKETRERQERSARGEMREKRREAKIARDS